MSERPTGIGTAVVVVDVDLPFWSMVMFMIKWALAAIPALLILGAVGFTISLVVAVAARMGTMGAH